MCWSYREVTDGAKEASMTIVEDIVLQQPRTIYIHQWHLYTSTNSKCAKYVL